MFSLFFQTALSNLEEMQHNPVLYRNNERGRSMHGVGPMRSRPMEKRYDTSPYSGTYLSPPLPDTWRRTNSDSALHQSANEACQSTSPIPHRRGSDACRCCFGYFIIFKLISLFYLPFSIAKKITNLLDDQLTFFIDHCRSTCDGQHLWGQQSSRVYRTTKIFL